MSLNYLEAIFLGILQGATEFLPVSSTGHLIIAEKLLGVSQEKFGLTFDAALHLGTALAVFIFFWQKWLNIFKGIIGVGEAEEKRIGFFLIAATVPAAVIGLLFEKKIETAFRDPQLVAWALVSGGIIIYLAEILGKQAKKMADLNILSSLAIGFSQAIALIPGISRSGVTISFAMFLGLKREAAAEFIFLLSGPIVLGAGGKKLLEVLQNFASGSLTGADLSFFSVGMIASALAGMLAIKFLLGFVRNHSLKIFVVYRLLLAGSVLLIFSR